MITALFNLLPSIIAVVAAVGTIGIAFHDYNRKPRTLRAAPVAREVSRLPLAA